jgi:hypothetical protein
MNPRKGSVVVAIRMRKQECDHSPSDKTKRKRDQSHEQVLSQQRKQERGLTRDFAENAADENPAAVKTNRQPERCGAETRISENCADEKQRDERGEDQHRI